MSLAVVPDYSKVSRRERLWLLADKKCYWCKCDTLMCNSPQPNQATIDHIIPRGRGGSDLNDNIVSACHACNQYRNQVDTKRPDHPCRFQPTKPPTAKTVQRSEIEMLRNQRDQALRRIAELENHLGCYKRGKDRLVKIMRARNKRYASMTIARFIALRIRAFWGGRG